MLFVWILKLLKIFTVKLVLLLGGWRLSIGLVFDCFNVLREYLIFRLRNLLFRVRHMHLAWGEWRHVVITLLVSTIFLWLSAGIGLYRTVRLVIFWVWLDLRGSVDLIWVNKAPSVIAGAPGDAAVIRPWLLMVRLWVVRLNNFWIRIHLSVFILICDSVISIWVYWCVLRILIHLLYLLFAHCVDGPREPVPRIRILLVKGWYFVWVLTDTLV